MTRLRLDVPSQLSLRLALLAVALPYLVASSGCYLSYRLSDGDHDAAALDAAVPDAGRRDAGRDGGSPPIDSGLFCPVVRADYLCLEPFLVQPGLAFSLPLSFATCGCCVNSECTVGVDAGAHTLDLTTTLCPDPCDCDACVTPTVSCEVPALAEGDWTVNVNGSAALSLPVFYDSGFAPPPPACVDFAEPSSCAGDLTLPGTVRTTSLACAVMEAVSPTAYTVELTDPCGGCARESTCVVSLQPRYTDDLPPGGELYVGVNQYVESCVDCLPTCSMVTRRCPVPPLVPGDVYRIHIDGVSPFTFVAGTDSRTCNGARLGV